MLGQVLFRYHNVIPSSLTYINYNSQSKEVETQEVWWGGEGC